MLSTTPTSERESPCSVMCTGVMTITQIMTVCEHTIARIATSARGSRTAMRSACQEPTRFGARSQRARPSRRGGSETAGASDAARASRMPPPSRMPRPGRRGRRHRLRRGIRRRLAVDREVPRLRRCAAACRRGASRGRRRPPRTRTARRAAAVRATGRRASPVCESSGPATDPIVVAQSTSDIDARLESGRRHLGRREPRLQARRGAGSERREAEEHERAPCRSWPRRSRARRRRTPARSPWRGRRAVPSGPRGARAAPRRSPRRARSTTGASPPIADARP